MNNVLRRGGQSQFEMKAGTCSFFPHFCLFVQKRGQGNIENSRAARPEPNTDNIPWRNRTRPPSLMLVTASTYKSIDFVALYLHVGRKGERKRKIWP